MKPASRLRQSFIAFCLRLIVFSCFVTVARGQSNDSSPKPWTVKPREIAFQNDTQWADHRWGDMDVGPFLAGSIDTPGGATLKGIAIRVGQDGHAAVCFDTALLRFSAGWAGGFLEFGPRRFGLIEKPRPAGKTLFTSPLEAGWALDGRFRPEKHQLRGEHDKGVTRLPTQWGHYKGLFVNGSRVVLHYSVGETEVYDSPWSVRVDGKVAFTRTLKIAAGKTPLQMRPCGGDCRVKLLGSAKLHNDDSGLPVVTIPPRRESVTLQLILLPQEADEALVEAATRAVRGSEDVSRLLLPGPRRWQPDLVTQGSTTEDASAPYVVDTLTLPFDNPWNALLFTAGHDFFANGDAAVCTVHGDVWVVSGIDRDLQRLTWRRFATGLFHSLGLKIVEDRVYVIGRDQITRLHDRNGDGEADHYENFNNDLWVSGGNHEYVTCLDTDPAGNFYFIHALTGVMRVAADGSSMTQVADGFRNPNGMAVGPDGTITAAPQEGNWTPASSIALVRPGGYYGYGGPRPAPDRPLGYDRPLCYIPRTLDNSSGAQVWVEGERWGPFAGEMLHLSYGQCTVLLCLREQVGGTWQGGTLTLPTEPSVFESGIMRGRFHPRDGQLYVSGLRGWQTRAIRDGCFQRVRYTGSAVNLPCRVRTFRNGIKLTFTDRLDAETASDVGNYFVEQWNYDWTANYGSPQYKVSNPGEVGRDEVELVSATLLDDGHAVFLEMPSIQPVHQMSIRWILRSAEGAKLKHTYMHTIHQVPDEEMPEVHIVRRSPPRLIADDVLARLRPGWKSVFQSLGEEPETDARIERLAALYQPLDQRPATFLPAGPFNLEMSAWLKLPLSGFFEFRIEGSGEYTLSVGGNRLLHAAGSDRWHASREPILLRKGHNHLQLSYRSPRSGVARFRLWWRGEDFDWEPIPPELVFHDSVFHDGVFHDSGDTRLHEGLSLRRGLAIIAESQCHRCHRGDHGNADRGRAAAATLPDLAEVGSRLHRAWLYRWLLDPRSIRDDVAMPAMLGDPASATARRDAADIAVYLSSLTEPPNSGAAARATGDELPDGRSLYEDLNCISCHRFTPPGAADEFGRVSLHFADAKFKPGKLAEFLRKPQAHFKATDMPDFQLSAPEAASLAAFVRQQAGGRIDGAETPTGDAARGRLRLTSVGCRQCHAIGDSLPSQPQPIGSRTNDDLRAERGCLAASGPAVAGIPRYRFSADEKAAVAAVLKSDRSTAARFHPTEAAGYLFERLRCAACHDRDGRRSYRNMVLAEEGRGVVPKPAPALTWTGEKLWPDWSRKMIGGQLAYKPRPWLKSRMPAFAHHAKTLAEGWAAQHGMDPHGERETTPASADAGLIEVGKRLAMKEGLNCLQCHAIGHMQPLGDKDTEIHPGLNFVYLRERLKQDYYLRFVMDPPRYEIGTNMPRLADDRKRTKLKFVLDGEARAQFDAVWHFIQSLPAVEDLDRLDR